MATATAPPLAGVLTMKDLLDHLGGISASRVRLNPFPGTATEADLLDTNDREVSTYELVDGVLVEKGMGYTESYLALLLAGYLNAFIIPRQLGILTGEAGMMRMFPGLVRVPDLAFASWDRMPARRLPKEPIAGFAPDLAVEVLSKSNTKREMARKRRDYFEAGVRLVWEVDVKKRKVFVYVTPDHPTILDASQTLDGGEVLPGFELPLADLFAELDRLAD